MMRDGTRAHCSKSFLTKLYEKANGKWEMANGEWRMANDDVIKR